MYVFFLYKITNLSTIYNSQFLVIFNAHLMLEHVRFFTDQCYWSSVNVLEFDMCRYDGSRINNNFVRNMKEYVDFIPVCPEVGIGLRFS